MSTSRYTRPLVVVAVTDLLLAVTFGNPWTAKWALTWHFEGGGSLAEQAAQVFLFSAWGAEENWELAQPSEHWRIGILLRLLAFLILHLWVVRWFARRAAFGSRPSWVFERSAVWVFGPAVGALAGLAVVIPDAFDGSVTDEERGLLRLAAVYSVERGAYWGLFSGAICWIVLTIFSWFAYRRGEVVSPGAANGDRPVPRLTGCLPVLLVPAFAMFAAAAVAFVAGSAAIDEAGDSKESHYPTAHGRLAVLVSHLHWPTHNQDDGSTGLQATVPTVALTMYLVMVFGLLMTRLGEYGDKKRPSSAQYPPALPLTSPDTVAASPGLIAFAKGWHAAIWAAILAAVATAEMNTLISIVTPVAPGGERGINILAREFVAELPGAAAYAALLGWVPAIAVLLAARLLRGLRSLLDDDEDADGDGETEEPADVAHNEKVAEQSNTDGDLPERDD
ncbi:hypothetical protein E1287_23580 [Actinomadura sp. KC06]|uniref:hypothetical protein n=1 Tax=Actinomadura sp. KC06 TaxID=2530369 RepID=UPI001050CE10|nr:hypothetical protein [Actinomadura sp. KC06]TDD32210.1 hypothetical protein E1287_23580 [Actinomadura sp. KC06]